ncbi:MAG TPA: DEAD/DEAH box helicase [Bacteroidales bacterium]|nr:DEAD/DEAH box helicase [Bacteroidales bacterium]
MKFDELGLEDKLLEAISYMGFEDATPVQEKVIPVILQDRDLIACAQTGTGKTGAFVLPVLNKLIGRKGNTIDTLIIVPTRELAIQIEQQIQGFSYFIHAESIAVYGGGDGNDWETEKAALKNGADIVIATPGKLLSHLKMNNVSFSHLKHLVLDEADRMLDMGFIEDIQTIISFLPDNYQTLMFSATMPFSIRQLAQKILRNPAEITLSVSTPAEGVDQKICFVHEEQKIKMLAHALSERQDYESIIIFSSTKRKVTDIVRSLGHDGFIAHGISSNLEQNQREEVLRNFRARKIRILVATDVMSRGIDIKEINLVVNFDVPGDPEDYVHRVGRTARVNARGEAITMVTPEETFRLRKIEKLINRKIPIMKVPESIGPAPSKHIPKKKTKHRGSVYRKNRNGKSSGNSKHN